MLRTRTTYKYITNFSNKLYTLLKWFVLKRSNKNIVCVYIRASYCSKRMPNIICFILL